MRVTFHKHAHNIILPPIYTGTMAAVSVVVGIRYPISRGKTAKPWTGAYAVHVDHWNESFVCRMVSAQCLNVP